MDNLLKFNKITDLPKDIQKEVLDFIEFLLNKKDKDKDKDKEPAKPNKPKFGSAKGMFTMKPDFDEPLEDFKDYM